MPLVGLTEPCRKNRIYIYTSIFFFFRISAFCIHGVDGSLSLLLEWNGKRVIPFRIRYQTKSTDKLKEATLGLFFWLQFPSSSSGLLESLINMLHLEWRRTSKLKRSGRSGNRDVLIDEDAQILQFEDWWAVVPVRKRLKGNLLMKQVKKW